MTFEQRTAATRFFVKRMFKEAGDRADVNTTDIFDAVVALDKWLGAWFVLGLKVITNHRRIVNALPSTFRENSTPEQQAFLIASVMLGRTGVL